MWMFPRAFEYYYPVVDRYLRSVSVHDGGAAFYGDCQAWILGCAIESQFHWTDGSRPPDYVIAEIRQLSNFVRGHLTTTLLMLVNKLELISVGRSLG